MADYSGIETVFVAAMPQIHNAKYPDEPFTRTVRVTDDAEDNFVITRTAVLISPKAIGEELNVVRFCSRIARACHDFDHKHEEAEARLQEEFHNRLEYAVEGILRRWGYDMLQEWMNDLISDYHANGGPHGDT